MPRSRETTNTASAPLDLGWTEQDLMKKQPPQQTDTYQVLRNTVNYRALGTAFSVL